MKLKLSRLGSQLVDLIQFAQLLLKKFLQRGQIIRSQQGRQKHRPQQLFCRSGYFALTLFPSSDGLAIVAKNSCQLGLSKAHRVSQEPNLLWRQSFPVRHKVTADGLMESFHVGHASVA